MRNHWKHREGRRRQHRLHKHRTKLARARWPEWRLTREHKERQEARERERLARRREKLCVFLGGPRDGTAQVCTFDGSWSPRWQYVEQEFVSVADFSTRRPARQSFAEVITYVHHTDVQIGDDGPSAETICWIMRHESLSKEQAELLLPALMRSTLVRRLVEPFERAYEMRRALRIERDSRHGRDFAASPLPFKQQYLGNLERDRDAPTSR